MRQHTRSPHFIIVSGKYKKSRQKQWKEHHCNFIKVVFLIIVYFSVVDVCSCIQIVRYNWMKMSNPPKEIVWIKLPTQNVFQKWSPFSENPLIKSILTKVFLLLLNSRRKALMVYAYTNQSMRKTIFMAYNN